MDLITVIAVVGPLLFVGITARLIRQSSREARCDRQVSRVHNPVGWAVLDAWGGGIG